MLSNVVFTHVNRYSILCEHDDTSVNDGDQIVIACPINETIQNDTNIGIVEPTSSTDNDETITTPDTVVENIDPIISSLTKLRSKYIKNLFFAHVNINSIRNKFDYVHDILSNNLIDMLAISETKLDDSFTNQQFVCTGFNIHRYDYTGRSGGIMVFIRNDIPHRRRTDLECSMHGTESLVMECIVRKQKWIVITCYKSPSIKHEHFVESLDTMCATALSESSDVLIMGDFNINMMHTNVITRDICDVYGFHNVISNPTCFKSANGTLIDPVLVNRKNRIVQAFNVTCGASDWHNLVGCITKLHMPRLPNTQITYRSYKHFNDKNFKNDISNIPFHVIEIFDDMNDQYWAYSHLLTNVLDEHAPLKTKTIKKNQVPYMNGDLRREMFYRNNLKNKFFKHRSDTNWNNYRKQRNKVVGLKRYAIKKYFINKCCNDANGKNFWQTVKPFMSSKRSCTGNIILQDNDQLYSKQSDVADILNSYYSTIADNIGGSDNIDDDTLENIILRHRDHPSVNAIKSRRTDRNVFTFCSLTEESVYRELNSLHINKATGFDNMPPKIVKLCSAELCPSFTILLNICINKSCFPADMKRAEIVPIFKKNDVLDKKNYRPVSVLPALSKLFEKHLSLQLSDLFENIFDCLLSAYRKRYGCQDVLLKLLESWRQDLDAKHYIGNVMMDLSQAFDSMPRGLLLAKLNAYGVDEKSCNLLCSYLTNRNQRVKLSSIRSDWLQTFRGFPQGSGLGPLLFNIFGNDLFYFIKQSTLYNYADDNTISYSHVDVNTVLSVLESDCKLAIEWFTSNFMQANPDKFQVLFLYPGVSDDFPEHIPINETHISRCKQVKLLGVIFDDKLKFDKHVSVLCGKASRQLNALIRISRNLGYKQRFRIYETFILSNFNFCPIVWHYCSLTSTKNMEKIQKRALRFLTKDTESNYSQLLEKTNMPSLSLHRMRYVSTEVFKCLSQMNPSFMSNMFNVKKSMYNLRKSNMLCLPNFNTVKYGKRSFQCNTDSLNRVMPE